MSPPARTSVCLPPSAKRRRRRGSKFPVGSVDVVFTATDAAGNVAQCGFVVTVVDPWEPQVTYCPPSFTVDAATADFHPTADGLWAAQASWMHPKVTDNVAASWTLDPHPADGAGQSNGAFAPGAHEVVYTAEDAAGNAASCTLVITVATPPLSYFDEFPTRLPEALATFTSTAETPYSDGVLATFSHNVHPERCAAQCRATAACTSFVVSTDGVAQCTLVNETLAAVAKSSYTSDGRLREVRGWTTYTRAAGSAYECPATVIEGFAQCRQQFVPAAEALAAVLRLAGGTPDSATSEECTALAGELSSCVDAVPGEGKSLPGCLRAYSLTVMAAMAIETVCDSGGDAASVSAATQAGWTGLPLGTFKASQAIDHGKTPEGDLAGCSRIADMPCDAIDWPSGQSVVSDAVCAARAASAAQCAESALSDGPTYWPAAGEGAAYGTGSTTLGGGDATVLFVFDGVLEEQEHLVMLGLCARALDVYGFDRNLIEFAPLGQRRRSANGQLEVGMRIAILPEMELPERLRSSAPWDFYVAGLPQAPPPFSVGQDGLLPGGSALQGLADASIALQYAQRLFEVAWLPTKPQFLVGALSAVPPAAVDAGPEITVSTTSTTSTATTSSNPGQGGGQGGGFVGGGGDEREKYTTPPVETEQSAGSSGVSDGVLATVIVVCLLVVMLLAVIVVLQKRYSSRTKRMAPTIPSLAAFAQQPATSAALPDRTDPVFGVSSLPAVRGSTGTASAGGMQGPSRAQDVDPFRASSTSRPAPTVTVSDPFLDAPTSKTPLAGSGGRRPNIEGSPGKSPGFKRRGSRLSVEGDVDGDGFVDRSEMPESSRGHTPVTGVRSTPMVRPVSRASVSAPDEFQDPRGGLVD